MRLFVYFLLSRGIGTRDDLTHYLLAKYSWAHPELFLEIWGRPAYTLLSSPFAQFGIRAAGFFNLLISVICCCLAFQLARVMGVHRPWLAVVFTIVQPSFLELSAGTLTEPLFSAILAGAILFYLYDRHLWSALCVSLLPLARFEGFMFTALWLLLLVYRKQRRAACLLFVFPMLWTVAGTVVTGEPFYLLQCSPYSTGRFGFGDWSHYLSRWPTITGPALLPLITPGLLFGSTRRGNVVHICATAFFVLQAALYRFGIGSAGYDRFFVAIAPLLGIIAAQGVQYLLEVRILQGRQAGSPSRKLGMTSLVILVSIFLQTAAISSGFTRGESEVGGLHVIASWMILLTGIVCTGWGMSLSRKQQAAWLTALTSLALIYLVRWKPPSSEGVQQIVWAEVARWYANHPSKTAVIASNTNWFWVTIGLDPYATSPALSCKHDDPQQELQSALPGTIFLWASDATLGGSPSEPADLADFKVIQKWKAESRDRMHYSVLALERIQGRERSQNVGAR